MSCFNKNGAGLSLAIQLSTEEQSIPLEVVHTLDGIMEAMDLGKVSQAGDLGDSVEADGESNGGTIDEPLYGSRMPSDYNK